MVKEKYSLEIANKNCSAVQHFCDDLLYLYESRHLDSESICQIVEKVYEWMNKEDYSKDMDGCQIIPIWEDEYSF